MTGTERPSLLLLILALILPSALPAQSLTVGDDIPRLSLPDQHGRELSITIETRILIFTADRDGGDIVNQVLGSLTADQLEALRIRNVADISGMPSFVARMFALPSMREYPYSILLGHEARDTAMLPRRRDRISVLHLGKGKIQKIEYPASIEELRQALAIEAAR